MHHKYNTVKTAIEELRENEPGGAIASDLSVNTLEIGGSGTKATGITNHFTAEVTENILPTAAAVVDYVDGVLAVNDSNFVAEETVSHTKETIEGSDWYCIAKLADPTQIAEGLITLKPSGKIADPENPVPVFFSYSEFKVVFDPLAAHADIAPLLQTGLDESESSGGSGATSAASVDIIEEDNAETNSEAVGSEEVAVTSEGASSGGDVGILSSDALD
jgi:hypothetical protein